MDKVWNIAAGIIAAFLLAGALSAVYGWILGVPFAAALVILVALVERRIIR